MAGLQCHKYLWLRVHEPDAPELVPDEATQALFESGSRVGETAQTYVPGGVLIEKPYEDFQRALQATAAAIQGSAPAVYEASFSAGGLFVAVDILERTKQGWNLIEVKSSTSAKPEHVPDVAVQLHTLRSAGLDVQRAHLMHLNRECRYPDLSTLFEREDLTDEALDLLPTVADEIEKQKAMLAGPVPKVEPGPHCLSPYSCPFWDRCRPAPPPHHISTLYRIGGRFWELERQGIRTIFDLPDDYPLSEKADRQRRSVLAGKLIVEDGLKGELDRFTSPIGFLDFETIRPSIPAWKGCRPYDQVPVQFSCHLISADGSLVHHEWLAPGPQDPREEMVKELLRALTGTRTILAYSSGFERMCLNSLGEAFPHFANELNTLAGRLEDLLPVVRSYVYHPDFGGSFSLKRILSPLVPDLGYDDLEVADGGTASAMLEKLILEPEAFSPEERKLHRQSLLEYCKMDTLALVRLHERLLELSRTHRRL